ncbi:hypothetical protein HON86_00480 [Candidatus Woesearchaeota archaeon]|jgi:hypothetical protein|nr:hypothetical protein [Candidatus Woesearchaeota archaeon]MBT4835083.1 hypothetical protein [Candidatus Woesearchaeota archaeon]MBT6735041.1 hypothetical protein [Candidatus Woesearchaeota archaeon]MBT7169518.1 hypothetical protein [Candidatus Woesearchaeota archaeon]
MNYRKYKRRSKHLISIPFIWLALFPAIVLDSVVELYHRVCFPLWGLPTVKRSDYIKMDRSKLSYLNMIDKINCTYCGYMGGLANYFVKIAWDTEAYWCGIKHKKYENFEEPKHHKDFLEYGDEKSFKEIK